MELLAIGSNSSSPSQAEQLFSILHLRETLLQLKHLPSHSKPMAKITYRLRFCLFRISTKQMYIYIRVLTLTLNLWFFVQLEQMSSFFWPNMNVSYIVGCKLWRNNNKSEGSSDWINRKTLWIEEESTYICKCDGWEFFLKPRDGNKRMKNQSQHDFGLILLSESWKRC